MSPPPLTPLTAAPRRVDVKAIDRELAELWRAAAASSEAERIALSRARTLTLVAYAPTPDAGTRLAGGESEADLLRAGPHPGCARGGGADPQPGQAGDPAGYAGGPLLAGAAGGGAAPARPPGKRPRRPRA